MPTVTRIGMFETNSSSTHSIIIAPGDFVPDTLPIRDEVCIVYPGEFGWEERTYYSARTKASYCLTYAQGDPELLDMLKRVIEAEVKVPVEFRPLNGQYYPWGYIDHQSSDIAEPAFRDETSLRAFIFNPNSELQTDNDNH